MQITAKNFAEVYESLSAWEKTQVNGNIGGQSAVEYLADSDGSVILVFEEHTASGCGGVCSEPSDCNMYIPGCIPLHHWL